jgi:glycopeptide antibiotics resistance protein
MADGLNLRHRVGLHVAARVAYVAVVLLATLSELNFGEPLAPFSERLARAFALDISASDVVDGVRNVLLFAGWGLVWSITASDDHRPLHTVFRATLTGMALSLAVETIQLFSPVRHASIADVATNTGGAFAGAVLTVLLLHATRAARSARSFVGVPMFVLAAAYGGAAVVEIVLPGMRQDLLHGSHGAPSDRFLQAIAALGFRAPAPGMFLLQLVLLAPAAALVLATLVEAGRSYRRAFHITLLAGVPAALLLELLRGATGQHIDPAMFLAHALGITAGAWLAFRYLPGLTRDLRGRQRPLALLVAFVVVLALWRWRPFLPAASLDHILASFTADHLQPIRSLATKMDLFSASIVAAGFLLHVPLGALLAVWPLRRRGLLAHVLPGIWVALVLEFGQVFLVDRFFDTTDVIIGTAGVLAGWALVRRAGFAPWGQLLPDGKGSFAERA